MCRKRQSHGSPSHLTLSYLLISPPPCLLSQVSRTFYVRPSLFPLHPSFPFIPHPISSPPHSSLLSPSSLIPPHPAPSHPKEPPHTPQAALAHKASSQPGPISFHILLLLRSAILLAVLCHHPMSRHPTFHVPSILPRFLLDPRASPSACWRIY